MSGHNLWRTSKSFDGQTDGQTSVPAVSRLLPTPIKNLINLVLLTANAYIQPFYWHLALTCLNIQPLQCHWYSTERNLFKILFCDTKRQKSLTNIDRVCHRQSPSVNKQTYTDTHILHAIQNVPIKECWYYCECISVSFKTLAEWIHINLSFFKDTIHYFFFFFGRAWYLLLD